MRRLVGDEMAVMLQRAWRSKIGTRYVPGGASVGGSEEATRDLMLTAGLEPYTLTRDLRVRRSMGSEMG